MAARRKHRNQLRRDLRKQHEFEREVNLSILAFRGLCGLDNVSDDKSNLKLVLFRDTTVKLPSWRYYGDYGWELQRARGLRQF
jgi:hypothetical protein